MQQIQTKAGQVVSVTFLPRLSKITWLPYSVLFIDAFLVGKIQIQKLLTGIQVLFEHVFITRYFGTIFP